MKETATQLTHSLLNLSGGWCIWAFQSSMIGMILIMAMSGAAQETKPLNGSETAANQQLPKPNHDLKSLDRLVGTWKISDPSGKGGVHGQVTYEWMEGGFFLLQRFDLEHGVRKIKGIEIIGHEQAFGAEPGKDIKSRVYDTQGNTLDYVYEVAKETLTIWGGQKGSPAHFKCKFSDDGNTCAGGWVYPGGGGYESTMTRVKKQ